MRAENGKQFKLQLFGHPTANCNHCFCSSVCVTQRSVSQRQWVDWQHRKPITCHYIAACLLAALTKVKNLKCVMISFTSDYFVCCLSCSIRSRLSGKLWVGKDTEGVRHGLFQGSVSAFPRMNWGKPNNCHTDMWFKYWDKCHYIVMSSVIVYYWMDCQCQYYMTCL